MRTKPHSDYMNKLNTDLFDQFQISVPSTTMGKKDPNAPKRPLSAYFIFMGNIPVLR